MDKADRGKMRWGEGAVGEGQDNKDEHKNGHGDSLAGNTDAPKN